MDDIVEKLSGLGPRPGAEEHCTSPLPPGSLSRLESRAGPDSALLPDSALPRGARSIFGARGVGRVPRQARRHAGVRHNLLRGEPRALHRIRVRPPNSVGNLPRQDEGRAPGHEGGGRGDGRGLLFELVRPKGTDPWRQLRRGVQQVLDVRAGAAGHGHERGHPGVVLAAPPSLETAPPRRSSSWRP